MLFFIADKNELNEMKSVVQNVLTHACQKGPKIDFFLIVNVIPYSRKKVSKLLEMQLQQYPQKTIL